MVKSDFWWGFRGKEPRSAEIAGGCVSNGKNVMLCNLLNIPSALVRLVNIKEIGRFALFCCAMAAQGTEYTANDEQQGTQRYG